MMNGRVERVRRTFRERVSTLENMRNEEVVSRYRLDKEAISEVLDVIAADIQHKTKKSHATPAITQLLVALRFFATGTFQSVVGDLHGVSQATASRCIRSVALAIAHSEDPLLNIQFPTNAHDQIRTKEQFHDIAGFLNVLGCVDGTHIPILAPRENEHLYVCRKGFHSMNVQAVCDANLRYCRSNCLIAIVTY